jgi:hypothetical protein
MAHYINVKAVSKQVRDLLTEVRGQSYHDDTSVWDSDEDQDPISGLSNCHQVSLMKMEWGRSEGTSQLGARPPCYGKEASPEKQTGTQYKLGEARRRELSDKLKKMGRHIHGVGSSHMQLTNLAQL